MVPALKKYKIFIFIAIALLAASVFMYQIFSYMTGASADNAGNSVSYELDSGDADLTKKIITPSAIGDSDFSVKVWAQTGNGSGLQMSTMLLTFPDPSKIYFKGVDTADCNDKLPQVETVTSGVNMALTRYTTAIVKPDDHATRFCYAKLNFALRQGQSPEGQVIKFLQGRATPVRGLNWQALNYSGSVLDNTLVPGTAQVTLSLFAEPTATHTPTPTPYLGNATTVCPKLPSATNVCPASYFTLVEVAQTGGGQPAFELRYYGADLKSSPTVQYTTAQSGVESSDTNVMNLISATGGYFKTSTNLPANLFQIKISPGGVGDSAFANNLHVFATTMVAGWNVGQNATHKFYIRKNYNATPTFTPTVTPNQGNTSLICNNPTQCAGTNVRPYFYLLGEKILNPADPAEEQVMGFELRYYREGAARLVASDDLSVRYVNQSGSVSEKLFVSDQMIDNKGEYDSVLIPGRDVYSIFVPKKINNKEVPQFVGTGMLPSTFVWTVRAGDTATNNEYLRNGYIVPTISPTPIPLATPTGFNLYLDPANTDPALHAVEVRLETGVSQPVRRGERFAVRIVASPKNTANFASEYIFLKEVKLPIKYALPQQGGVVLDSIQSTGNPNCSTYKLEYPQMNEISSVSAFYLKVVFKEPTKPVQLRPDTCLAEFTFDVTDDVIDGSTSTVELLSATQAVGIQDRQSGAFAGLHAFAYALSATRPAVTPAVTPVTIDPRVNMTYDPANSKKTFTVSTARSVATNAPDLQIEEVKLVRKTTSTAVACGPVYMQVKVKNAKVNNVLNPIRSHFLVNVNGATISSVNALEVVFPTSAPLPSGSPTNTPRPTPTVFMPTNSTSGEQYLTFQFNKVSWGGNLNTIVVDSTDLIIEKREDNNSMVKRFEYADIPGNTNTACPNPTVFPTSTPRPTATPAPTSLTPTATLTPLPTLTLDPNKVNLRLTVKLQGVSGGSTSGQYSRLRMGVAIGGGKLTSNTAYTFVDFVSKGSGQYEGIAVLEPTAVPPGTGYKIIVKGPKHLAKRFCIASPTGGYAYFCPANASNITLVKGTNDFNFSSVELIAGDLPLGGNQDGVVDSSDLAFIRENLGIKRPDVIKVGDLNLDGIVDTQDYSMIINNLVNNEDEN